MIRSVARPVLWVQLHPLQVQLYPLVLHFAPNVLKAQNLTIIVALPCGLQCKWFYTLWDFGLAMGLTIREGVTLYLFGPGRANAPNVELFMAWKIFNGKCCIHPVTLFSPAPQGGTRGHQFKVGHVRVQTDVRRRAFSVRCVNQWNGPPRDVVTEQDYRTFKNKLATALGDKLYWYPP